MTCQEYREEASAWFDGESGPQAFEHLVMHAHDCASCREFLGRMPGQSALLRRYPSMIGETSLQYPARQRSTQYRFNAPLAVAAAIMLVILTIAVQGNLQGRSGYPMDGQGERPASFRVAP